MTALRRVSRILVAALFVATLPSPLVAQDTFDHVPRVVAVGDVHGGYDEFVSILRAAGLVDGRRRWTGGTAHLVQTGDVLDRGRDSRKVLDLLMALEKQAKSAGGRVHALLGNHEVMNVTGDLRYVSEAEFNAFRTVDSLEVRQRAFEILGDRQRQSEPGYRQEWETSHPLGWVEHRVAFGPKGKYGKWLRGRNTIVRINGILFVHGGISPKYLAWSLHDINERVRAELDEPPPTPAASTLDPPDPNAPAAAVPVRISTDPEGPLWYRGLAERPESEIAEHVAAVLSRHEARLIAVGHTRVAPAILPRAGGRVVLLDVGLSPYYGGPPACLVAEGTRLLAIHRGHRLPLPPGSTLLAYLEAAARVDPQPSALRPFIESLAPIPAGAVP